MKTVTMAIGEIEHDGDLHNSLQNLRDDSRVIQADLLRVNYNEEVMIVRITCKDETTCDELEEIAIDGGDTEQEFKCQPYRSKLNRWIV